MATAPIPTQYVVPLKPSFTLAQINQWVTTGEQDYGPLYAIGHDNSQTLLTFVDGNPPAPNAVIAPQNAGVPDVPAGAKLVATGTIFVSGALVLAAATRGP